MIRLMDRPIIQRLIRWHSELWQTLPTRVEETHYTQPQCKTKDTDANCDFRLSEIAMLRLAVFAGQKLQTLK
jgi:hypothetical protein